MTLTHEERAERRRMMAEACRTQPLSTVALEYGVSLATIYHAMQEHGIRRAASRTRAKTLHIIGDLLRGMPAKDAAAKYQLSHQRIYQIQESAEEAGIL